MNYEKCYLRYKYGVTYKSIAPALLVIEPHMNYVILLRHPALAGLGARDQKFQYEALDLRNTEISVAMGHFFRTCIPTVLNPRPTF